jgi:hypothetical protein
MNISDRVQRWVIDAVDPQATIHAVQQLKGGISSLVHRVSLSTKQGIQEFVLRSSIMRSGCRMSRTSHGMRRKAFVGQSEWVQ